MSCAAYSEGRRCLEAILELAEPALVASVLCADVLHGAGFVAYRQADYQAARAHLEQALALRAQLGDAPVLAAALTTLGTVADDEGNTADSAAAMPDHLGQPFDRAAIPWAG